MAQFPSLGCAIHLAYPPKGKRAIFCPTKAVQRDAKSTGAASDMAKTPGRGIGRADLMLGFWFATSPLKDVSKGSLVLIVNDNKFLSILCFSASLSKAECICPYINPCYEPLVEWLHLTVSSCVDLYNQPWTLAGTFELVKRRFP